AAPPASGRGLEQPGRGVQRLVFRRPDAQHAPEVLLERPPVLIAPLVTDDERQRAAGPQRAPHLLIGKNAALDAAGIEKRGEARVIRAPEFVVERQEGAGNLPS